MATTYKTTVDKEAIDMAAGQGALSGMATGAAIGSAVPGVGTLIGAGIGAAVGGLAGAGMSAWGETVAQEAAVEAGRAQKKADEAVAIDAAAARRATMAAGGRPSDSLYQKPAGFGAYMGG